jgi:uncharacterized membrane protein
MTLESSKNLGGIGAILIFIGILPYANYFGILELVGAILVLVALHGLANYYKENGIFSNALYGLVTGIVGGIIAAAVVVFTILTSLTDFIYKVYPGWNGDWTTLQGLTPNTANINPADLIPFIAGIFLFIAIVWIFAIIAAFFVRRSLKQLSAKSNVGLFGTAGLLLLIGAALIIIFGLGLILIWIAALVLSIAFFTMKPQEAPMVTAAPPPPTPV